MKKWYITQWEKGVVDTSVESLTLKEARQLAAEAAENGGHDIRIYMEREEPADAVLRKWGVDSSVITRVYREDYPDFRRTRLMERMLDWDCEMVPLDVWHERFMVENVECVEEDNGERKVLVTLTNGTQVTIEPCHESWQQYGGNAEELWKTVRIAEEYNAWLHGVDDDEDEE